MYACKHNDNNLLPFKYVNFTPIFNVFEQEGNITSLYFIHYIATSFLYKCHVTAMLHPESVDYICKYMAVF